MMTRVISFLQESKIELKRVNWPTLAETRRLTLIVIGFSIGVAAFLGIWDMVFLFILEKTILRI